MQKQGVGVTTRGCTANRYAHIRSTCTICESLLDSQHGRQLTFDQIRITLFGVLIQFDLHGRMFLKRGIKGIQCISILLQSDLETGTTSTAKCAEDQNENNRKKKTEEDGGGLSDNGPETGFRDCPNGLTLAV